MNYQELYKFKKGDKLDKVAKTWGLKSAETVWEDKLNKALKKKRKTIDNIQSGDKVYIPFTLKQQKAILEKTLMYMHLIDGERIIEQLFLDRSEYFLQASKIALSRAKASVQMRSDLENSLRKTAKNAKTTMKTVDVVAEVLKTLAGIGKINAKASKASGAELTKLNKEALKKLTGIPAEKAKAAAKKTSLTYLLKQDNIIGQTAGALYALEESYTNLTSPGFWAKTIAGIKEGKSWFDAINFDLDQDITNRLNIADRTIIPARMKAIRDTKTAQKSAKECLSAAKNAVKRIKAYQKEIDKLPVII